jgi:hypothetical protein
MTAADGSHELDGAAIESHEDASLAYAKDNAALDTRHAMEPRHGRSVG